MAHKSYLRLVGSLALAGPMASLGFGGETPGTKATQIYSKDQVIQSAKLQDRGTAPEW